MLFLGLFLGCLLGLIVASLCNIAREKTPTVSTASSSPEVIEGAA